MASCKIQESKRKARHSITLPAYTMTQFLYLHLEKRPEGSWEKVLSCPYSKTK